MALHINEVTLAGNLGKEPEPGDTKGGTKYARFSLATTEKWNDAQGNKQEKTEWHRCIIWGKQADTFCKWVKKGHNVYIRGAIQYGSYENRDGQMVYTTDIKVQYFRLLNQGVKRENSAPSGRPEPAGNSYQAPQESSQEYEDEDIPF